MFTRFKMKGLVLPLLLAAAMLFPPAASAEGPDIPDFSGAAVIELNDNRPAFSPDAPSSETYVAYSELDGLGRVGPASACLGRDCLPTGLRAESGDYLPAGWRTIRYDEVIDGYYLYSLCHVISPALSGSDADPRNVFTGTRYFRLEGMRPFEDLIADYIGRTANHVLYRVTPVYRGEGLVPAGVQLEAYSAEDAGKSVCFNVFIYNVQPGVVIDYGSGESSLNADIAVTATAEELIRSRWLPALTGTGTGTGTESTEPTSFEEPAESEEPVYLEPELPLGGIRTVYIADTYDGIYHAITSCSSIGSGRVLKTTEQKAVEHGYQRCEGDCAYLW